MSNIKAFPGKRVFILVTGASKGLGRVIARRLSQECQEHMHFLLTSRDEQQLKTLQQELQSHRITVDIISGSLNEVATLDKLETKITGLKGFDQVVLVNNAGSLGYTRYLTSSYSPGDFSFLQDYWALNLTSMTILTGSFLDIFSSTESKIVVNISSLVAVDPIQGLSIYGAGKAARDAFIRSIVKEYPSVMALNYAPGPLQTDMAEQLKNSSYVTEFYSNPQNLLTPEDSTEKLVKLLKKEVLFENGSHVDYYDVK